MGTVKEKVCAATVNRAFSKCQDGVLRRSAPSTFYLCLKMGKTRGEQREIPEKYKERKLMTNVERGHNPTRDHRATEALGLLRSEKASLK